MLGREARGEGVESSVRLVTFRSSGTRPHAMIRISPRQLITIAVLGGIALLAVILDHLKLLPTNAGAWLVFLAAALAVLSAPSEGTSPELLDSLRSAVRRVLDGKRPDAPAGSQPAVLQIYNELEEAHEKFAELSA